VALCLPLRFVSQIQTTLLKHEEVAVAPADIAAIDNAWFRGVV
jgi:hypothetical protein